MGSLYIIENLINHKVYIGITKQNPNDRWIQHKYDARHRSRNYPLYNSMNKYGIENFSFTVLIDNVESPEELSNLEVEYIKKYNSTNRDYGYNLEPGGRKDYTISESTRKKMSKATKENYQRAKEKNGGIHPCVAPEVIAKRSGKNSGAYIHREKYKGKTPWWIKKGVENPGRDTIKKINQGNYKGNNEIFKKIYELRQQGLSVPKIEKEINKYYSDATIYSILKKIESGEIEIK